jgi:hypothetical protein
MATFGNTFDATGIEPAKSFEVLPPGQYPARSSPTTSASPRTAQASI